MELFTPAFNALPIPEQVMRVREILQSLRGDELRSFIHGAATNTWIEQSAVKEYIVSPEFTAVRDSLRTEPTAEELAAIEAYETAYRQWENAAAELNRVVLDRAVPHTKKQAYLDAMAEADKLITDAMARR